MTKFVIRISGKDLESVTGSVKGIVQSYVRGTHKYDDARFDVHRRAGRIAVLGVPRAVIVDGLTQARSKLLPQKRFTYEIEERDGESEAGEDIHAQAEAMFVQWTESTQREWEQRSADYESRLVRLTAENNKLRLETENLKELRTQDAEQLVSLKRSYEQVSRLVERMSEERAQSPLEMADLWVEDGSVAAKALERDLEKYLGDEVEHAGDLTAFDFAALAREAAKVAGLTDPPGTTEDIEALIVVGPWEETEEYARLHPEYERARAELDYLESVEDGTVEMPESLRETLLASVDKERLRAAVHEYESLEAGHTEKRGESDRVAELLNRFERAERLRALAEKNDVAIPAVVACEGDDGGWDVEVRLPRSDGNSLRPTLEELARDSVAKAAGRKPSVIEDENLIRVSARLAGKYKSWKEASRVQEAVCAALASGFRETPLGDIGLRLRAVKVMVGPTGT